MRSPTFGLAVLAAASTILGCSRSSLPVAPVALPREARWQDVFAVTPDLVVMVHPQALRRDPLYGALLERSIELARMESQVVAATRALEAIGDAEEVVVGTSSSSAGAPEDLVVVVQGVRGDIDPVRLVDSEGRTLWSPGPSGGVRELVRRFDPNDAIDPAAGREPETVRSPDEASLFELPGRTWVIAAGHARQRARDAFAQQRPGAASIPIDRRALASVRIAGPSLVAHVRALQDDGGLAALGRGLRALTLVLPPDGLPEATKPPAYGRSVQFNLSYEEERSAELAEAALRRVIAAIAHLAAKSSRMTTVPGETVTTSQPAKTTVGLEWLGPAVVTRSAGAPADHDAKGETRVTLTAVLPRTLIDDLLRMSSVRWAARSQTRTSAGANRDPVSGP